MVMIETDAGLVEKLDFIAGLVQKKAVQLVKSWAGIDFVQGKTSWKSGSPLQSLAVESYAGYKMS